MGVLTIWESADVTVSQAGDVYLPGYLLVESHPSSRERGAINAPDEQALAFAVDLSETLVDRLLNPDHIHVVKVGRADGRVNFHIIPETSDVRGCCLQSLGDAASCDERRIADTVRDNYSVKEHGDDVVEVLTFVSQARSLCRELLAASLGRA